MTKSTLKFVAEVLPPHFPDGFNLQVVKVDRLVVKQIQDFTFSFPQQNQPLSNISVHVFRRVRPEDRKERLWIANATSAVFPKRPAYAAKLCTGKWNSGRRELGLHRHLSVRETRKSSVSCRQCPEFGTELQATPRCWRTVRKMRGHPYLKRPENAGLERSGDAEGLVERPSTAGHILATWPDPTSKNCPAPSGRSRSP